MITLFSLIKTFSSESSRVADLVILGIFPANDFQDIDRSMLFSLDGGGRLTRNTDNVITDNIPKFRTAFLLNHIQYILRPFIDKRHKFLNRKYEYFLHDLFTDFYDWDLLYDSDSIESRK